MVFFEDSWNFSWKSATTDSGVRLEVYLPGYGKDDVDLGLYGKKLQIKTKDEKYEKTFKVLVPIGSITADMANGVLKIDIHEDKASESITKIEIA